MALIFFGSTGAGSVNNSSRIIGPFLRWLKPDISEEAIRLVLLPVRKSMHVAEYAILAMLIWRARRKPVAGDARPWNTRDAFVAVGLAALYAATDEFHQWFVATRGASVVDVLIDTFGACIGVGVIWALGRWMKRW